MLRNNLLCTTVAVAALALAGTANAQSYIWGGGSTLAQPYYVTIFNLLNSGTPAAYFGGNQPGETDGGYAGLGSGGGRTQFETNYGNGAKGVTTTGQTGIDYGASDAYLGATEISNWATTWTTSSTSVPASTSIPAMLPVDGPLIQLPMEGTPVTLAYDITPNLKPGKTVTLPTHIILTNNDLCGIYSGKITSWAGVASIAKFVAANASKFESPAFGPLNLTVRSDSSGTTFLFTQHLTASGVCTTSNSNFSSTFLTGGPISQWSGVDFVGGSGGVNTGLPSNFVQASGSSQVANYLTTGTLTGTGTAPADAVGYISPDYTSIAPNSGHSTSLPVASLTNSVNAVSYVPTIANTALALANPGKGVLHAGAPTTKAEAENQADWVPSIPTPASGYPIVGYTNMIFAQCYADNNVATELLTFLTGQFNGTYATQLTNAGFNPLPKPFVTAIQNIILANVNKYNPSLAIQDKTICKSATGATKAAKYVGR